MVIPCVGIIYREIAFRKKGTFDFRLDNKKNFQQEV